MSDNFLRGLLARAGIKNDIASAVAKAAEKNAEKLTEAQEMKARIEAANITKKVLNAILEEQQELAKLQKKPTRTIITGDE
jgi:uncharacterized protein YqfA (UPF0365 family)